MYCVYKRSGRVRVIDSIGVVMVNSYSDPVATYCIL